MNTRLPIWLTGSLVLGLAGLVAAKTSTQSPAEGTPPDLKAGAKIYQLDVTSDARNVLANLGTASPITVQDVHGAWIKVQVPSLPYGRVWLNTQQIVYYRTTESN